MIRLSVKDVIELYGLASIGKLVGGLIHNINGPMQNLGLDIEIASYSLKDESKLDQNTARSIISRLKRMEEEHDKINSLIRATSARVENKHDQDNLKVSNLNEFINQELGYLNANLYFKHNVHKEVINKGPVPSIDSISKDSLTALGWFLQSLVEELERQKVSVLIVRIDFDNSAIKLFFSIKGGALSDAFNEQIKKTMSFTGDPMKEEDMDMGLFLAFSIFSLKGITVAFNDDSSQELRLDFPEFDPSKKKRTENLKDDSDSASDILGKSIDNLLF
jgi:hypothetical protein